MEATCGYAGCRREVARDGMCIFHLPNKNLQERLKFKAYLLGEIARMQKDSALRMIDLSGFRFPEPAYKFPAGTRFEKAINFREVVFEGQAEFSGSVFLGPAVFDQTKFSGNATFDGVRLSNVASFVECEFSSNATFSNSEFSTSAEFGLAKFSGNAVFSNAKFSGNAIFSGTKFSAYAAFRETKFLAYSSFEGVEFSGFADFAKSKFSGQAEFLYAKFSAFATFDEAEFLDDVFFDVVEFLGDVSFDSAKFSGMASFYNSKIAGTTTFRATLFQTKNDQILASPIKQHTIFEKINVDTSGEVRFEGGICMSRVSLHHADIRRFSFLDVKWGRLGGRASIMEHGMLKEPKRLSKDAEILPDVAPEHVQHIYVRLRRNLERGAGRYPEAGDFFINEKEMRKLILQEGRRWPRLENLPEWVILKVYGGLALYGESIMRPIFWIAVTVFAFTTLKIVSFRLQTADAKPYLDFLMESVMAFFQMRSEPGLDALERLISVPILGSLFIALKRKFERR